MVKAAAAAAGRVRSPMATRTPPTSSARVAHQAKTWGRGQPSAARPLASLTAPFCALGRPCPYANERPPITRMRSQAKGLFKGCSGKSGKGGVDGDIHRWRDRLEVPPAPVKAPRGEGFFRSPRGLGATSADKSLHVGHRRRERRQLL